MRKTWRRVYLGVADFSPLVLDRVKQKYLNTESTYQRTLKNLGLSTKDPRQVRSALTRHTFLCMYCTKCTCTVGRTEPSDPGHFIFYACAERKCFLFKWGWLVIVVSRQQAK